MVYVAHQYKRFLFLFLFADLMVYVAHQYKRFLFLIRRISVCMSFQEKSHTRQGWCMCVCKKIYKSKSHVNLRLPLLSPLSSHHLLFSYP